MNLKEHLSQRLVGIQVDCNDAQRCLVQWLQDSGTEVDAIGQKYLDKIDPHLKLNLPPDNLSVHAANGGRFNVFWKLGAQLTIGQKSCSTTLHVLTGLQTPLLSKQSCIQASWRMAGRNQGYRTFLTCHCVTSAQLNITLAQL